MRRKICMVAWAIAMTYLAVLVGKHAEFNTTLIACIFGPLFGILIPNAQHHLFPVPVAENKDAFFR